MPSKEWNWEYVPNFRAFLAQNFGDEVGRARRSAGLREVEIEADVERRCGVSQRPDRDEIDPGRGNVGDGLQRHSTGGFQSTRPAVMATASRSAATSILSSSTIRRRPRSPQLVIERHALRSRYAGCAAPLPRQRDGARDAIRTADRRQVVILDQHAIGQPEAAVRCRDVPPPSPARADRCGLASVHDARLRAAHRGDVPRGDRGHAGEMLQQVQGDALLGEQVARRSSTVAIGVMAATTSPSVTRVKVIAGSTRRKTSPATSSPEMTPAAQPSLAAVRLEPSVPRCRRRCPRREQGRGVETSRSRGDERDVRH